MSLSKIKKNKNKNKNNKNININNSDNYPKNLEEAQKYEYKFWNKQPLTKIGKNPALSNIIDDDIIDKYKNKEQEKCEFYSWYNFDLSND